MFIPIENCATESSVVAEKSISIFAIGFRSIPSRWGPFDNQSVESSFSFDSPLNNTAATRATSNLAEIRGIPPRLNLGNKLFTKRVIFTLRDIKVRKHVRGGRGLHFHGTLFRLFSPYFAHARLLAIHERILIYLEFHRDDRSDWDRMNIKNRRLFFTIPRVHFSIL